MTGVPHYAQTDLRTKTLFHATAISFLLHYVVWTAEGTLPPLLEQADPTGYLAIRYTYRMCLKRWN